MQGVSILNPSAVASLVLTCEHAVCFVPEEYGNLGLRREELVDHIGWDIGAALVAARLATFFTATAILSGVSRLLIDCNRDLHDPDLIVTRSDGIHVPGNASISESERARRIAHFYEPYHHAIDAVLRGQRSSLLLSLHSFTPSMNGRERRFDIGVLFDVHTVEAAQLGAGLAQAGFAVRYNEPYSGLDGLIYSAKRHGAVHAVRYLELEINNRLLRDESSAQAIADRVAPAIAALLRD